MSKMSNMNGEKALLKLFEDTNVPLLHLSPNVIKGWFDTDDQDQRDLMNWMCTSLSTANYVSSLEVEEFENIKSEITEQDVIRVEKERPDIFNIESLELEKKRLQSEFDLALQEEQRLDESISLHKTLKQKLSTKYQSNVHAEAKAIVKFDIAKDQCNTLAEKLDELYHELLEWSDECCKYLCEWRFDPLPKFINAISIENLQEKFNSLVPCLEILISDGDANSSTLNETLTNRFYIIKNRIRMSQKCLIISNVQKEEAQAKLNYLRNNDISTILSLTENFQDLYDDIETNEKLKSSMSNVLEKVSQKITDCMIFSKEFELKQQQLQFYQNYFDKISKVEDLVVKVLFMCSIVNILCKLERRDIENAYNCTKYIPDVINNIEMCSRRIDKMREVITNQQLSPDEKRFNLIYSISKIVSNDNSFSLNNTFNALTNLKRELNQTEIKVYDSSDRDLFKNSIKQNILIMQSFLMSGPTCQPIIIPSILQVALKDMEGELKKQASVLTHILDIAMVKKQHSKWETYLRHLWMFFYRDPNKLKFVLEQIKMELTRTHHS